MSPWLAFGIFAAVILLVWLIRDEAAYHRMRKQKRSKIAGKD